MHAWFSVSQSQNDSWDSIERENLNIAANLKLETGGEDVFVAA